MKTNLPSNLYHNEILSARAEDNGQARSAIIYTYYSAPWLMRTGDDVRVHKVSSNIGKGKLKILVLNLSVKHDKTSYTIKDNIIYQTYPRKFYKAVAKLLRWNEHADLNALWKITLYIDELLASAALAKLVNNDRTVALIYVFGSMSLMPWLLGKLGRLGLLRKPKPRIMFDPLSNYSQTLYLQSRKNIAKLLKYGLYLALHKLSISESDVIVYPSRSDKENAERMFALKDRCKGMLIIPNPIPICYESTYEYLELRNIRRDNNVPYFVLLAGGRGKTNYEAVKLTIEIFNILPPDKFRLFITGPWNDLNHLVRNPSIHLVGLLPERELKALLAACDYGLSPIFSHIAGTFVKMLTYITADLYIICSPHSLVNLEGELVKSLYKRKKIALIRNHSEYKLIIQKIINTTYNYSKEMREPLVCKKCE